MTVYDAVSNRLYTDIYDAKIDTLQNCLSRTYMLTFTGSDEKRRKIFITNVDDERSSVFMNDERFDYGRIRDDGTRFAALH